MGQQQMEGGGLLTWWEEGTQVRLEVSYPRDDRGLYKAWALGGEGGSFLLGTLAPERGALRLARRVSRQSLLQAGCWPVTGGRVLLVYPFSNPPCGEKWRRELCPERLCRDPLVQAALRGRGDLYSRETGGGAQLSAPFRPEEPFPLPLLFCLAQVERRGEGLWLVWAFDRGKNPMIPAHKPGEGGEH